MANIVSSSVASTAPTTPPTSPITGGLPRAAPRPRSAPFVSLRATPAACFGVEADRSSPVSRRHCSTCASSCPMATTTTL
eukprot:scaffold129932_cov84-Phaeocystis_antarctica.AAC.1